MSLIVFSPHLDDGVLSASVQLTRTGATLLTVFGGLPPAGTPRGAWDRLTGAASCRGRQLARLAENQAAASILGCDVETWDELEAQYRAEPVDRPGLIARIRSRVAEADEIWVPAAIGSHPDHVAVREMVVAAAIGPESAARLRFYADLPYSLRHGWPTWVTGDAADPHLDVDGWLSGELVEGGFDPDRMTRQVHSLDQGLRSLKERAALAYRSQMPALGLHPREPLRWNAFIDHEVAWAYRTGVSQ